MSDELPRAARHVHAVLARNGVDAAIRVFDEATPTAASAAAALGCERRHREQPRLHG